VSLITRIGLASTLMSACFTTLAVAQSTTPNVPQKYRRFFYQYADQRQVYEKALNLIGLTSQPVGRSFALIAGVSQYPNLSATDRDLEPAGVDIEKLKTYLKDQEYFDEIVVLKDGDFNLENLNFFLETYFPDHLAKSPIRVFSSRIPVMAMHWGREKQPAAFCLQV
jgi:hypothetical protein